MSELDFSTPAGIPGDITRPDRITVPEGQSGLVRPHASGDDEVERSLRPRTLAEFVGQPRLREQMQVFIAAATERGEALDHALFAGPPGLGKCVTADTMVFTPIGMVPIGSLGSVTGESWQPITRPITGLYGMRSADWFYSNGEGSTIRITTEAGYRVEGTPTHPVLVRDVAGQMQFRRLTELRIGDRVAVRVGAQVFGGSTRLHIEGVPPAMLDDPAVVPEELSAPFARFLGLLLTGGRLSPGGDGFLVTVSDERREDEIHRLADEVLCVDLEDFGVGPIGRRIGQRSPRIARLLAGLGLTRDGFGHLPAPIYRAPREMVIEFLRGVFWGTEHAPGMTARDREVASHLQLLLANIGIESRIHPVAQGWRLSASVQPMRFDLVRAPADLADDTGLSDAGPPPSTSLRGIGFGMTSAGLLATTPGATGSSRPVTMPLGAGQTVSVAEVEPLERSHAITRERLHTSDSRALAVRSIASTLRSGEVVELIWEQVVSIEPSHAYTCDVSVPDGHTFIGNGIVCHNTTLASVVAGELGSTLHQTSGPALEKKADVAAILTSLGPRDVLFIDEIHRLNAAIEEVLYSAMEDYQIDVVLGQGPAARTLRLDLEPFTLVGATTRTGLLTTPLRDRFGFVQRLEYYTTEELTLIVHRSAGLLGVAIDNQAASEIAMRSRGTPRIANRLLRRVRDVAQVRHCGAVTLDVAREALDLVDIDGVGLDRLDRSILETILTKFSGGPVGLSTLSVALGEEPSTIEDVYEPFLLQRGFLQRTPRGRIVTDLGRAHLGIAPAAVAGPPPLF